MDDLDLEVGLPAAGSGTGYPITLRSSAGRLAGFDFAKLATELQYRGSTADIARLVVDLAGGNVELAGNITFGPPGRSPFDLETSLTRLDSGELAAILLDWPRGYISGDIGGDIALRGDSLDWETLKRSLAGRIQLEMGEGALENVNLINTVVERLVADPGLGQLAANSIRDVAPRSLQGDRTPFENIQVALDVANGSLQLKDLNLMAGEFLLSAVGAFGLDGSLSGDGKLRFSKDLSARILKRADRLAPLLGDGEIVELPLLLGGDLSSPRINPDLAALVSNATDVATEEVQREVKKRATDLLTDVLFGKQKDPAPPVATGGEGIADGTATGSAEGAAEGAASGAAAGAEETAAASDTPSEPAPTERDRQRDAAESLINEGLGRIFGK